MQVWVSESAGRKEFVDYIRDTYSTKPVLLCEARNLLNSLVVNSSAITDPTSQKYNSTLRPMGEGVRELLRTLESEHLVVHSLITDQAEPDIELFFMHAPQEAEALYRLGEEGNYVKHLKRDSDIYNRLKTKGKERVILLNYDERFRDFVSIDEENERGIVITIPTNLYSDRLGMATPEDKEAKRASTLLTNVLAL